MKPWSTLLPAVALVVSAAVTVAEDAFVCQINALTPSQRERHQKLGQLLRSAVVEKTELENGYAFVMDLGRLPVDSAGESFCVVEVAEWVDLESRCCPFLAFGIEVEPKGKTVRLRLTGAKGVKTVLESELELLEKGK
ncbi:MAG TPA: hypothetical protein VKG23_09745 [Thermoanaerobaculia bacterium]|nr:hypothetical protein [Thermoanaerobaculia bacterium]